MPDFSKNEKKKKEKYVLPFSLLQNLLAHKHKILKQWIELELCET